MYKDSMKMWITEEFYISDIKDGDQKALIKYLNDRQIYDQTLNIPFPYTQEHADKWITYIQDEKEVLGLNYNFCIRRASDEELVGGIGFGGMVKNHRAEIGYWLARPFWCQGIMKKAVSLMTEYGFKEFKFVRITAHIFDYNTPSAKVLENNGYLKEGYLRKYYFKNDRYQDGILYAKVRD